MKLVSLHLPISEDSSVSVVVAGDFSVEEFATLEQYTRLMARVRACALLSRGMGGFGGLTLDKSGLTIRSAPCTDGELYELLHLIRPITLEDETASFKNVAALLGRRLRDPNLLQFLKINNRVFRDGEMSLYLQISVGRQKLFAESLLHTWLNGTQYHTDSAKAESWSKLEGSLGEPNAKAVVLSQLHSKVMALMNVDYVAHQVLVAPGSDA